MQNKKHFIIVLLFIFYPVRSLAFDVPPAVYQVEVSDYDFAAMVPDDAAARAWNALAQDINILFVENGSFVHATYRDGWRQMYVVGDRMSTAALQPAGAPMAPSESDGSSGSGSSGGTTGGSSGSGSGGSGLWAGIGGAAPPSPGVTIPYIPGYNSGCLIEVPGEGRDTQYIVVECDP